MTERPNVLQDVRKTRRDLAEARDAQLLQVVTMIDRLDERGDADGILSPLRERLRSLRPARPLRFARLLFTPLDHLIVDASAWRPGGPFVSRVAIGPLVSLVRSAAPAGLLAEVDRLIAAAQHGQPQRQRIEVTEQAGALLWSLAASVLQAAMNGAVPPSWVPAGMPSSEFLPVVSGLSFVLDHAPQLQEWERQGWVPELDRPLAGLLREAAGHGPRAWGMVVALLMQRFPESAAPFESALAAPGLAAGFGDAGRAAFGAALSGLEKTNLAADDVGAGATARIGRLSSLVEGLAANFPDAQGRSRAQQQKLRLQESCVSAFRSVLRSGLTDGLQSPTGTVSDDALEDSESTARQLRQFEQAARRLGGGARYDGMLAEAACGLQRLAALDAIEKGRLVEILQGPQAAWNNLSPLLPA